MKIMPTRFEWGFGEIALFCVLFTLVYIVPPLIMHTIPSGTAVVDTVEIQHCVNPGMDMTTAFVQAQDPFVRFYRSALVGANLQPGDVLEISLYDRYLGWFHMGSCLPVDQ